MLAIFLRTIRDKKISLLVYCLAGILTLWMFVGMYPTIFEQAEKFNELASSYPEGFLKAFGIDELSFDTLEKFLSLEQFSILWPLMVIFMIVSLAGTSIAREVEKGTMEILLSRSVSRLKIFLERYLAGLFMIFVFMLFSIFSVIPLAKIYNVDYMLENYFTVAFLCLLFSLAIFSMAMMFSVFFSERGKVYMATGAVLVLMYFLKIASSLKESLENLKYVSFFHYFDAEKALIDNEISLMAILVFVGVIIICTLLGAIWFKRRDIAI